MSKSNRDRFRIAAEVPDWVRQQLLSAHVPNFERVFARSVTWAYGVDRDFWFDAEDLVATVTARHIGSDHEALLVSLGSDWYRPDGKRLFLTLSTAPGVEPRAAGEFSEDDAFPVPEYSWPTRLRRCPLWKMSDAA